MAYEIKYNGYVKFIRGTTAAWNSLVSKDPDTLYFIADNGSATGALYLGDRLIAGGGEKQPLNLTELADVLISENVSTNSLLIYDESVDGGKWVNRTLSDIFELYMEEMEGATESTDGASGLVPAPVAGEQNLFLQGNGTWADPTAGLTEQFNGLKGKVDTLDENLGTLVGEDLGKSIREIAQSEVQIVVGGASDAFNTLLEVEQWIESHGDVSQIANLTANVAKLEDSVFGVPADDEAGTAAVPGLVEVVSNLQDIVSGNEEKEIAGLVPQVDNMVLQIEGINNHLDTIDKTLEDIDDRLRWQDLVETTEE